MRGFRAGGKAASSMGLIAFGTRRVGFWMPGRPERTLEEVPEGLTPEVTGTLDEGGVSLIVAAADPTDAPEWAVVTYAPAGAAVVIVAGDRLFIGLGPHLLHVDETGRVLARGELPGEELVTAWQVPQGLAAFTRTALVLLDEKLTARWRTPLGEGQFQLLDATGDRWRIVQMGEGDYWETLEVDAGTGAVVSRTR